MAFPLAFACHWCGLAEISCLWSRLRETKGRERKGKERRCDRLRYISLMLSGGSPSSLFLSLDYCYYSLLFYLGRGGWRIPDYLPTLQGVSSECAEFAWQEGRTGGGDGTLGSCIRIAGPVIMLHAVIEKPGGSKLIDNWEIGFLFAAL